MTLEGLHRNIDKLLAAIEQHQGRVLSVNEMFQLHLFSEQEQEQLQTLTALLLVKCSEQNNRLDLSDLSNQELNQLSLWLHLQAALDKEDLAAAAEYRRALAWSYDTLVETFLAIPESSIPTFEACPVKSIKEVSYHLYKTAFRADKSRIERALAANDVNSSDMAKMRLWCETFAAA